MKLSHLERKCKLEIRKTKFYEKLSRGEPILALEYLRSEINHLFDVSNPDEVDQLHFLASEVFNDEYERDLPEGEIFNYSLSHMLLT